MKLGISGKISSGKTTIAKQFDAEVIAIGNSIKKTSGLLIEDHTKLKKYLERVLDSNSEAAFQNLVAMFAENYQDAEWIKDQEGKYIKNQWYRKLTQDTGDVVRELLGRDIWCKITITEAEQLFVAGHNVICDDIRLKVEKELFEEAGFTVIRLNLPKEKQGERVLKHYGTVNEKQLNHFTEVDLDDETFVLELDTTVDTIEQTTTKLKHFLKGV